MSTRRIDIAGAIYRAVNVAVVAFLLLPIAVVGVFALNPTPYIAFPPVGVTLHWFAKFFSSAQFMHSLMLSLRVAAMVVVLATIIGGLCALAIARGNIRGARLLTALFLSPLMLPAILTGLSLFQVFMLAGIVKSNAWGWGSPKVLGLFAIALVGLVTFVLIEPRRRAPIVDFDFFRSRSFFGANVVAFIVSFGQFPISLFLVVPNGETLPVVLFNYIRFDLDGAIAAASVVSIAIALAVVLLIERIIGLRAYVRL